MTCWSWLAALFFLLQVPPPTLLTETDQQLEADRRSILAREASELSALAADLARQGKIEESGAVRSKLPRPVERDGPTRFMPLPEVVEQPRSSKVPPPGIREIQDRAGRALFDLAGRAAEADSPQYALASVCLRAVLEREPDHKEARRLLGYARYKGGWATPFAVGELKKKCVNHPIFGWVPADWVPHLDGGELPAPLAKGQKQPRWLPVAEADRLRADWKPPWKFATEHFEIQTNVTLAEAISFGRRLEAFHDLFMTLCADILGENIPLIRRFKDPKLEGDGPALAKLHQVYYFASKADFVEFLTPRLGADVALNLGFYDPPKSGRGRVPAYFYRDPDGQIPETATLYHEVSHQLLFETAGPNAYTRNAGNIWVFEGLGAYFETITQLPDGSLEVGGLVGPRIDAAIDSLVVHRKMIPMAEFVAFDEATFRDKIQMYQNYQQAIAMTVFFMQWNQGAYRDAFLDYVRDAYHGRIKRTTGRKLQDRLRQPYKTLEKQFVTFLKEGKGSPQAKGAADAKPTAGDAIRTVPSGQ